MLTIGRTLMGNPDLLLLDEPSEGLAPLVVRDLGTQIRRLKDEGITILLCEQNARFATALSDRAYLLEKGHVRFSGTIAELQANEEVRRQYLAL
jgi:branched-chain amino acid transport system ATP-binding protein